MLLFYKYEDEEGKIHCIEGNNYLLMDFLTGKEFCGDKSKLELLSMGDAQDLCNEILGQKIKPDKKNVTVLVKPATDRDSLSILLVELSKRGLAISTYIPHVFTKEEVEVLYSGLRKRSFASFIKNSEYLISGESVIATISGKNARVIIESIIGNKDPNEAEEYTLRSQMGSNTTCNGIEIVDDEPKKLEVIKPIIRKYVVDNGLKHSLIKKNRG